jgi:hypothetical protein
MRVGGYSRLIRQRLLGWGLGSSPAPQMIDLVRYRCISPVALDVIIEFIT